MAAHGAGNGEDKSMMRGNDEQKEGNPTGLEPDGFLFAGKCGLLEGLYYI